MANLARDSRVCFFLAEVIGEKRIFVFSYLQNRRLFFCFDPAIMQLRIT